MGPVSSDDIRDEDDHRISGSMIDGFAMTSSKHTNLISASELPSAAAALAELFPDEDVIEEIAARSRGHEPQYPSNDQQDQERAQEVAQAEDLEEERQALPDETPIENIEAIAESARSDAFAVRETGETVALEGICSEGFAESDKSCGMAAAPPNPGQVGAIRVFIATENLD